MVIHQVTLKSLPLSLHHITIKTEVRLHRHGFSVKLVTEACTIQLYHKDLDHQLSMTLRHRRLHRRITNRSNTDVLHMTRTLADHNIKDRLQTQATTLVLMTNGQMITTSTRTSLNSMIIKGQGRLSMIRLLLITSDRLAIHSTMVKETSRLFKGRPLTAPSNNNNHHHHHHHHKVMAHHTHRHNPTEVNRHHSSLIASHHVISNNKRTTDRIHVINI